MCRIKCINYVYTCTRYQQKHKINKTPYNTICFSMDDRKNLIFYKGGNVGFGNSDPEYKSILLAMARISQHLVVLI